MRFWTVAIATCVFCSLYGSEKQKVLYESIKKGEAVRTLWELVETDLTKQINGVKKEKNVDMEYSSDALLSYSERIGKRSEFSVTKIGPSLIVKSRDNTKEKTLSHKIGSRHWIQDFTFGFQQFITGPKTSCEFCIVYPKDLGLHEMVATKEGPENVEIGGKTYTAERVKITLTGFKKQFWKASALYDRKTGILVHYKANEGPGTGYIETNVLEM